MRSTHPILRGGALAFTLLLPMALLGTPELLLQEDPAALNRPALAFAAMAVLGAFVAAVPQRLRRLHGPWRRSTARGCMLAFVGGLLGMLGLMLAQAGELRLLCGVLQGGLGALAFAGCAWLAAAVTAALTGRWQA